MNKKGISTIVATVLIVLITVAAVTILWAALSPLISQTADEGVGCFNVQNAIQIDSDVTYTCYNTTSGDVNLRVTRNANTETLQGFETLLQNGGNTVQGTNLGRDVANLPENGGYVYTFTNADYTGTLTSGDIVVSVAPQITVDGELSSCTAVQSIELKDC